MRRTWLSACKVVRVSGVSLYEGTKDSTSTRAPSISTPSWAAARSARGWSGCGSEGGERVDVNSQLHLLAYGPSPTELARPEKPPDLVVEAAGIEPDFKLQFPSYFGYLKRTLPGSELAPALRTPTPPLHRRGWPLQPEAVTARESRSAP